MVVSPAIVEESLEKTEAEPLKYVAFDLEIASELPEGDDWRDHLPLGISCAATYSPLIGGLQNLTMVWMTTTEDAYAERMTVSACEGLLDALLNARQAGYDIVTWNGLGFDFPVLAAECGPERKDEIVQLALDHVDMAYQMLCDKGFMIGLETAAQGMRVGSKLEGMHGDLAPTMWKQGKDAQERVLEYVAQDAKLTGQLYEALVERRSLHWRARSGNTASWFIGKLVTVAKADEIPLPDTSWMSRPWSRSKFIGWTTEVEPHNDESAV